MLMSDTKDANNHIKIFTIAFQQYFFIIMYFFLQQAKFSDPFSVLNDCFLPLQTTTKCQLKAHQ